MKTPDFKNYMNKSWKKYKGKLSREKWEKRYKTLYKNREKGKISESKFKDLMSGEPLSLDAGNLGRRNIDNFLNGTTRVISKAGSC